MSESQSETGPSIVNPPGAGGRGRGGGRNGARGDGRGGGRNGRDRGPRPPNPNRHKPTKTFSGSTEGMQGHVFQGYGESPDKQQFTKTVEALATYISTHMDYPKDVASICKKMTKDEIAEPVDLT